MVTSDVYVSDGNQSGNHGENLKSAEVERFSPSGFPKIKSWFPVETIPFRSGNLRPLFEAMAGQHSDW